MTAQKRTMREEKEREKFSRIHPTKKQERRDKVK